MRKGLSTNEKDIYQNIDSRVTKVKGKMGKEGKISLTPPRQLELQGTEQEPVLLESRTQTHAQIGYRVIVPRATYVRIIISNTVSSKPRVDATQETNASFLTDPKAQLHQPFITCAF